MKTFCKTALVVIALPFISAGAVWSWACASFAAGKDVVVAFTDWIES